MVKEIVPSDDDVLLGRGTKHHLHPGNQRYNGTNVTVWDLTRIPCRYLFSLTPVFRLLPLAFLELNSDRYMDATNPVDKKAIIIEIVNHIVLKNGRFLKRVVCKDKTKQWIALSTVKAHLKTAHAIQYRMRKKSSQNVRIKMTTNALLKQQLTHGTAALLQPLAPRIKLCSYGGCQRLATEHSALCYYCHCSYCFSSFPLAQPLSQCTPSVAAATHVSSRLENDCPKDETVNVAHHVSHWTSGFTPILSCSAADDNRSKDECTKAVGILLQSGRQLETDCVHECTETVSRESSLDALLLPEEEDDPVDRIVSLFWRAQRTNSFVSLDVEGQPSDLCMAPRDIDDSASIGTTMSDFNGSIDSDWLGSFLSLDQVDGYGGGSASDYR
jgi:hypothetical protein